MEITPEVQAQLDEAKKNCPFCKIIAGEYPADEVYTDDKIHAVLDLNPWLKGHVLYMQKEHFPIMPYIPPETFKYMFGKLPKFVKALKNTVLTTGANVVIANGAAAGQQSPHFLVHVLPREEGDWFDKYGFTEKKEVDAKKLKDATKMLSQNIPIMMNNHFKRNPASWRQKQFQGNVYEDEKTIVTFEENHQALGHLKIVPKGVHAFEDMDEESAAHLFYVASFCGTAVFEGLGAHGSNIILKTGFSHDNPDGSVSVHVLPRYQDDGLDLVGEPMEKKPDNKALAKEIKDKTYIVGVDDAPPPASEVIAPMGHTPEKVEVPKVKKVEPVKVDVPEKMDEITAAIEKARAEKVNL